MRKKIIVMWIGEVGEGMRRSDKIGNMGGGDSRIEGRARISRRSLGK